MFVSGLKMLQYMTGGIAIQAYLEVIFRQSSSISGPLVSIIYGFVQLMTGKLIYKNFIFENCNFVYSVSRKSTSSRALGGW